MGVQGHDVDDGDGHGDHVAALATADIADVGEVAPRDASDVVDDKAAALDAPIIKRVLFMVTMMVTAAGTSRASASPS